jgi:hypothetical protein
MSIALGVIDDARRRQRRRRVALASVALVAAAIALVLPASEPSAPPARPPTQPAARLVGWKTVLTRVPYMGVACTTPNSTRCERVGLAVWLRRPAAAVSATVVGRRFALHDEHWRARTGEVFAGYVHGPGLGRRLGIPYGDWQGNPTPYALVRVRVLYRHGARVTTRVRVPLMAGWG